MGPGGKNGKEWRLEVRKNHSWEVPEHPVIAAMERDGEYPAREKKRRSEEREELGITN